MKRKCYDLIAVPFWIVSKLEENICILLFFNKHTQKNCKSSLNLDLVFTEE